MKTTWDIKSMNVLPEYNNYKNVVYSVTWIATFADDNDYVCDENSVVVNIENITFFTEYEKLSKSQVLNWVMSKIGTQQKQKIEDQLQILLTAKKQPTAKVTSPKLPWA
jgi:hypothetical protein